jgi:hypothetical protein
MSGDETKKVTVGVGAEHFSTVAVVIQAGVGENARPVFGLRAVFGSQTVERGQGDAESTIEALECVKEFGFELMVLALLLRRWIGAYSFMNSHLCLLR